MDAAITCSRGCAPRGPSSGDMYGPSMCMPTIAGSENLRMDRTQLENRSSEDVMRVGRNLVTPVALSASVACFNWSAVQPGVLKSTPAKPLTCKSKKPGNSILISTLELFCCALKQTATSAFQVIQEAF